MELNIGDKVSIFNGGRISRVVTIEHVTSKRAYAQKLSSGAGWAYEMKREIGNCGTVDLVGMGTWSTTSANVTIQEHYDQIKKINQAREAEKFFETLMKDKEKMVEVWLKLKEGGEG